MSEKAASRARESVCGALGVGMLVGAGLGVSAMGILMARQKRKLLQLRDMERRGRTSAAKELRTVTASKINVDGALFYRPIGTIRSCFTECVGTPRQGHLAPATRAEICLNRQTILPEALDTLDQFSHVWVFFAFHLNTTSRNNSRAHSVRPGDKIIAFSPMVTPPFLKRKVGVLATRTPHRPNNLGMSLCRLETVKARDRILVLAGVDLVDGTPVLDIKPYVPHYDCVPDVSVAAWINEGARHRRQISWSDAARRQLHDLLPTMKSGMMKGDEARTTAAITQSLEVDVRSSHKTRKTAEGDRDLSTLKFDGLLVRFESQEGDFDRATVTGVERIHEQDAVRPPTAAGDIAGVGHGCE